MATIDSRELVGHRYILSDQLGKGGMGIVHRAFDRLTGDTVALKRVLPPNDSINFASTSSDEIRLALAREFKLLATLRHPHIISVVDYGFDEENSPYFVMELLENPKTLLEAGTNQPLSKQIGLIVQVLQALAYLHRYGVLHRDLKPENVLVANDQAKVLDFGLHVVREKSADADAAGTLAYIAPEVLQGIPASEASDLYAVGLMFYELFAGRHPFDVDNMSKLINDVLYTVPDISTVEIDSELSQVLERLLAKDPKARYSDATKVIVALNEAAGQSFPVETAATRESFLQAAPFAGRDRELARLLEALGNMTNGNGSAWLIGGESGVGKTRLLDELRIYALVKGALVVRGQDINEGSNPYQLWHDVLRRLCLKEDLELAQASILKPLVPDIGTLLGRDVPDALQLDADAAQDRLFTTIEQLFLSLPTPTIVFLEDLHWTESTSLLLLLRLNRLVADHPLMIIGTYRDDERPTLPQDLPGIEVLKLDRLADEGIEQLAVSMIGEAGHQQQLINLLKNESDGNVFFLIEVVRALAEQSGQLSAIGESALPEMLFPGGMRQIIHRRLDRVPPEARPLLRLAAVSGRELDLQLLQTAAPEVDLDRWLITCADAVVLEVSDAQWRFSHDKLRQGVLAELSQDQLVTLHRKIAEAIETVYPTGENQQAIIAYHWEMAQEAVRAAEWYARAGQQAEQSYAPEEAIEYYHKALAFLPDDAQYMPQKMRIYHGLGKMLRWQARFDDATAIYNAMRAGAEKINDQVSLARAWIGLGDVQDRQGNREAALTNAEQAETIARHAGSTAQVELIEALGNKAWSLYRLGKLEVSLRVAQEVLDLSTPLNLQSHMARSLNTLGIVNFLSGNFGPANDYMQQALEITRRLGDRRDVGIKLNNLGEFSRLNGEHSEAVKFYEEALTIFEDIGYRDAELAVLNNLGAVLVSLQQYETAERNLRQVILLTSGGSWWGLSETYRFLAEATLEQGNIQDALDAAKKALAESEKAGDEAGTGKAWRLCGMVLARSTDQTKPNDQLDTPAGCFTRSLEIFTDRTVERARTLLAWAQYELEDETTGDKGQSLWKEAFDIFSELGMEKEVQQMSAQSPFD